MKNFILSLSALFSSGVIHAQCSGGPPPPGYGDFYSLDTDDDGFTTFDLAWYIQNRIRPVEENTYGVNSSGYDMVYYNESGEPQVSPYTNVVLNEFGTVYYTYNGSGPEFQPQPPCFWPLDLSAGVNLVAVPFDGDLDNDGIPNAGEDTNHNGNLMDDDDDHDGTINLFDTSTLWVMGFTAVSVRIYPNPVTNGFVTIDSKDPMTTVAVMDAAGKIFTANLIRNRVDVRTLAKGTYFLRIVTDAGITVSKVVVE